MGPEAGSPCRARKSRLVERVEELEQRVGELTERAAYHTKRIAVLEEQVLECTDSANEVPR